MKCVKHDLFVNSCSKWYGGDPSAICVECMKEVQNNDVGNVKDRPVDFREKHVRGVGGLKVKPLRVEAKRASVGKYRQ